MCTQGMYVLYRAMQDYSALALVSDHVMFNQSDAVKSALNHVLHT